MISANISAFLCPSIFSSLDKDQIKVVIDKVTRWLDLAEEGDQMTLPGISGRQEAIPPHLVVCGCHGGAPGGGEHRSFALRPVPSCLPPEASAQ